MKCLDCPLLNIEETEFYQSSSNGKVHKIYCNKINYIFLVDHCKPEDVECQIED